MNSEAKKEPPMPDDTQTEFCWLVEEFTPNGNSTGRYMLDMGSLAITHDVYAARRLRREQSAGFRALDMKERHGGDWRPVEHGFEPAPAAQPAMPEPVAFEEWLERNRRKMHCGAWSDEACMRAAWDASAALAAQQCAQLETLVQDQQRALRDMERINGEFADSNGRMREALQRCRKMVGHPDNIAFIDAALAATKGGETANAGGKP